MRRLPNFVVVGAPRSGTTSLFYWLDQHPDVYLPVRKELHHFTFPILERHARGPGDERVLANLCRTWEEYAAYYDDVGEERAVGEISPSYLLHADVRHDLAARLGAVRVIAVLRDPVEKAYSQYLLLARQGLEELDFFAALRAEEERRDAGWGDIWWYARGSKYAAGIEAYAETFGRENLLVLRFEDLAADPAATLREVFGFLEVDAEFACDTSQVANRAGAPRSRRLGKLIDGDSTAKRVAKKILPERWRVALRLRVADWNTGAKPEFDAEARAFLVDYFAEDVARLERFLGRTMGWSASDA